MPPQKEKGNVDSKGGKKLPKDKQERDDNLTSVVSEIMRLQADSDSIEPELQRLIGGFVDKEVKLTLEKQKNLCSEKWDSGNEIVPKSRSLQLQFLDKISLPVLTGRKIKAEGSEGYTSILVALVDGLTKQVVNYGPEASAKVEIVVLEKNFNGYEGDNWTLEEFNNKIIREWEGKRSLLKGNVYLNLQDGIGSIGDLYFTHTKNWMPKSEFRLGAQIVDGSLGIRVREAMTDPFTVEDCRGKLYEKHHPPFLFDEVWRLEKIGKGGAFHIRLSKGNITTVKDFVTLLNINPQKLKDILGVKMSAKMWDSTVCHARKCVLDTSAYLYYVPIYQQKTAVVFNVVGELRGILVEQQFIPVDNLSQTQKAEAHQSIVSAFQHWGEVVPVDDEASLLAGSQQIANALYPSNSTTLGSPNDCNFETHDMMDLFGNTQQDTSLTDNNFFVGTTAVDDFGLLEKLDYLSDQPVCFQSRISNSMICEPESVRQDVNDDQLNFLCWSSREEVQHAESSNLWFTSPVPSSPICDTDSMIQAFFGDEHLQFSDSHCSLQSNNRNVESRDDPHIAVNDPVLAGSVAVNGNKAQRRDLSGKNAQRRWKMLFSIMRWFSVRRNVARKPPFIENHDRYSSHDINPSIYSIGALNSFNNHHSLPPQNSNLESQANVRSAVSNIRLGRPAVVAANKGQRRVSKRDNKAQRRWKMLFSIMRWFSVKRNVTRKTPVKGMPQNLGVSARDIMPSTYPIGYMNGFKDDGLLRTDTMDLVNEQPLSFPSYIAEYVTKSMISNGRSMTQAFSEDEHLQLLDPDCSTQFQKLNLEPPPNLHGAVNDIPLGSSAAFGMNGTHRIYLLKRSKAHKRWRMLFSIVQWFLVRRNVARRSSIKELPFQLSASSQDLMSSKAQRRWRMLFSIVRWFSVRRNVARRGRLINV